MISESKNLLDHSIFNDDKNFASPANERFASKPSGGGGYFSGSSSSSSGAASSTQAEDTEEESTDSTPPQEEEEAPTGQLVRLNTAQFITPENAKIDEDIEVEATFEYLTERTPPLTFCLMATYNGVEEVGPIISAEISEGTATATLNLKQHMDFYFTEERTEEDKIEYSFSIKCDEDGTLLQGDVIELPELPLNIDIVEIADSLFNSNSAVPCLDPEGLLIASIQATLKHAQEWPDKELVIYGHTDTSGENDINFPLSEKRAQAFKALLMNDDSCWNSAIENNSSVLDYQSIINALNAYGWSAHCGEADGIDGPNTESALKSFQTEYNENTGNSISTDGIIGPQTWDALRTSIHKTATHDFEHAEVPLTFGAEGEGTYPCGESFPIEESLRDRYTSSTNRRCEIGFHERPNPPLLVIHSDPSTLVTPVECPVYDSGLCTKTIIPLTGIIPDILWGKIHMQFLSPSLKPIKNATLKLTPTSNEHITDNNGEIIINDISLKEYQIELCIGPVVIQIPAPWLTTNSTIHRECLIDIKQQIKPLDIITAAQFSLSCLDYYDGSFDGDASSIRTAVQMFQKDHEIEVTGTVDPITYEQILALL
ncbi:MAG: peptidoglycan-binding protein [Fibrobacterales bacterium]